MLYYNCKALFCYPQVVRSSLIAFIHHQTVSTLFYLNKYETYYVVLAFSKIIELK